MIPKSSNPALIDSLEIPAPNLQKLGFCKSNRAASVVEWSQNLPLTQVFNCAKLLYGSVPEIVRLQTSPAVRMEMLEAVRPFAQQILQGLTQKFIDQPLLHSEAALKTAIIAQSIQRQLTQGYCLAAKEFIGARPNGNFRSAEKSQLALALQRAVAGHTLQLLRSAQIYSQPPVSLWQSANTLYQVAENLKLASVACPDPMLIRRNAISIEQSFIRLLLLASAGPNRLSPREIQTLYDLTENWCTLVKLSATTTSEQELFIVDLHSSSPPRYRDPDQQLEATERILSLRPLLDTIDKQASGATGGTTIIEIPDGLPPSLIRQLLGNWGERRERKQPRNSNRAVLEVAIGLTNIHFLLAGQIPLREFVSGSGQPGSSFAALDVGGGGDPWDSAFDAAGLGRSELELGMSLDMAVGPGSAAQASADAKDTPTYRVQMLDFSACGMRVDWRGDIPSHVKTGDILSLVEAGQKPKIGLIRWARQHKHGTQLGLQIIASKVEPAAAQLIQKVGDDGDFLHALLAAESRRSPHMERLIVSARPFRERSKVRIRDRDGTSTALLTEILEGTSTINCFKFRPLENMGNGSPNSSTADGDDFTDKW